MEPSEPGLAPLRRLSQELMERCQEGRLEGTEAARIEAWIDHHGNDLTPVELEEARLHIEGMRLQLQSAYRAIAERLIELRDRRRGVHGYAAIRPITAAQRLNRKA